MQKQVAWLFGISLCFAALLACSKTMMPSFPEPDGVRAIYESVAFEFAATESSPCIRMNSGAGDAPIAQVYVELRDGSRCLLPDLEFAVAMSMADGSFEMQYARGIAVVCQYETSGLARENGRLAFIAGRLHRVSVQTTTGGPITAISLTENGPYIPVQFDRKQMIAMFGEPERWEDFTYYHAP